MGIASRRLPVLEWARYLYERCVLMPAADVLPRGAALALADIAGFADAVMPSKAPAVARGEIVAATGARGSRAWVLTARRLAAPRRDLVMLRRLRRGREHPRDWTIIPVHGERVEAMLAAGLPFVICTGHFTHAADQAAELSIPPRQGYSLHSPIPPRRLSPSVLRERLQNRLLYGISRQLAGFGNDVFIPFAGVKGGVTSMVAHLRQPGTAVGIFFDAFWERPGAYHRPFAGMNDRGFALGSARVARLAQVPIVFYTATWAGPQTVRLEYGPWIEPPAPDDEAADVRIIDQLADALEAAVARHPLQYLHPIGAERRWDGTSARWRGSETAGVVVTESATRTAR